MNPFVKALKSFYEFFTGDAILLVFVAAAFGITAAFRALVPGQNALAVVIFVGFIVAGLMTTLIRSQRSSRAQYNKGEK